MGEAIARIFGRAARRLHHAVERHECGDQQLAHQFLPPSVARACRSVAANASGWPGMPYSLPRNPPWPLANEVTGISSNSATAWLARDAIWPWDSSPAPMTMRVVAARRATTSGSKLVQLIM